MNEWMNKWNGIECLLILKHYIYYTLIGRIAALTESNRLSTRKDLWWFIYLPTYHLLRNISHLKYRILNNWTKIRSRLLIVLSKWITWILCFMANLGQGRRLLLMRWSASITKNLGVIIRQSKKTFWFSIVWKSKGFNITEMMWKCFVKQWRWYLEKRKSCC